MNATQPVNLPVLTAVRWVARFSALALAGLVLFFAIGQGFNPFKLKPTELALTVPFGACWVGFCLGWRWEGWGGLLVVAGVSSFYLVHFAVTGFGHFPRGWAVPALAGPGVLFLLCWFWRRRMTHSLD
jgi:hypothetical protein